MSLALQAVAGTRTPLGVVAVGTGNDFARALGLPVRDPAAAGRLAAEALKGGADPGVDLGRVGGRSWFGTVLASGFDSRVNDRGQPDAVASGRFKYDLAMVAELAAFRPIPYRITLDDGRGARDRGHARRRRQRILLRRRHADLRRRATWTTGCSTSPWSGTARRTTLLKVFPQVYKGTHLDHPKVTIHRVRKITLAAAGITGYADGEPLGRAAADRGVRSGRRAGARSVRSPAIAR